MYMCLTYFKKRTLKTIQFDFNVCTFTEQFSSNSLKLFCCNLMDLSLYDCEYEYEVTSFRAIL